jgi:hypothetical protein
MSPTKFAIIMGAAARENRRVMRYRSIKPLIVDAIQAHGPADVPTDEGMLHAAAGDWLVRDPHGNTKLCKDLFFRRNFTAMPGSEPVDQFRERTSSGGC